MAPGWPSPVRCNRNSLIGKRSYSYCWQNWLTICATNSVLIWTLRIWFMWFIKKTANEIHAAAVLQRTLPFKTYVTCIYLDLLPVLLSRLLFLSLGRVSCVFSFSPKNLLLLFLNPQPSSLFPLLFVSFLLDFWSSFQRRLASNSAVSLKLAKF